MTNTVTYHESVMVDEVLAQLHLNKFSKVIDATLGTGGHSHAILETGADLLGIEADPKMLEIAKSRIPNGNFALGNFSNIDKIAIQNGFSEVDGVLMDIGVSNLHLKNDNRGFSFTEADQQLDMRLNPEIQGVTAADLLNVLDKTQLTNLFARILKFNDARKLAERVFDQRPVATVGDLKRIAYGLGKKEGLDSATLPMLALRIAVNSELENLKVGLEKAYGLLKFGGKLLVITFHSKEDEIVEKFNKNQKVILPSGEEVYKNKRARSAKLRVITKI